MARSCPDCGTSLESAHPNRQRCPDCASVRRKLQDRACKGIRLRTDAITCPVCEARLNVITAGHFRLHGYKTAEDFKTAFNLPTLKAPSLCQKQAVFMAANSPTKGRRRSVAERTRMSKARRGKGRGNSGTYARTPAIRARISRGVTAAWLADPTRFLCGFGGERLELDVCGPSVWVRSSWEARVLRVLDAYPEVDHVDVEPFSIPYVFEGVDRQYIPDFLVHFTCGIQEVWEVKPQEFLAVPRVKAKIIALNNYVTAHAMNGRLVTLADIQRMEHKLVLGRALGWDNVT